MLELALCDDEKEILPLLRGRIKAEFAACGEAVSITSFHDPAMFLAVSYTHLDVYKRQMVYCPLLSRDTLTPFTSTL